MLDQTLPLVLDEIAARLDGPLVIVDVGAQSLAGEAHAYQALTDAGLRLRVVGFEPQADRAAARRVEDPGAVILECFIGDGQRRRFHLNNVSGTSSVLPLDDRVCRRITSLAGLRTLAVEEVETVRLDQALAGEPAIDFLKLDIQGFELTALQGGPGVLQRTAMVQCEVEFAPIYEGQKLFAEVELHLRAAGFGLVDLVHLARRAPVAPSGVVRPDRLLWADAVFAAGRPGERALLAQAIVFAGIYGKLGMAEQALAEFDRRTGDSLAPLMLAL